MTNKTSMRRPGGSVRLWQAFAWALLAPLAGASARAAVPSGADLAELPLEQLLTLDVSSASKFAQKLSEAPSAVTVITAAEIKAYGWRTLADLLRTLRGLYVTNDRNYSHLGARGFLRAGDYNGRFLLMVDGARVNDAVYDAGNIGYDFLLDLDTVERVEFVPGPGSSIYGAQAVFGVINVISKRGRDALGGQAAVSAASAGSGDAQVSYGWRGSGEAELLLAARAFSTRGRDLYFPEYDSPQSNNGVAQRLDYERAQNFLAKGSIGKLQLSLAHMERTKGVPTASYEQTFNDPRSRTIDVQTLIDLQYSRALSPATEASGRVYWHRADYNGTYTYPRDLVSDGSQARQWSAEFKLVSEALAGQKLVAGVELQNDYRRDQYYDDERTPLQPLRPMNGLLIPTQNDAPPLSFYDHRNNRRLGLFMQDEISLGRDLLLNAGLRHDSSSSAESVTSPRFALIWKASADTTFKALYGSAFRTPNAYELYYMIAGSGGGAQSANPNLRAERIRSRELVAEHAFDANRRLTLSLYHNNVSNLINQVETAYGTLQFENQAQAIARGLEAEYQQAWDNGARLRSSLAVQRAKDGASGREMDGSPRQAFNFNLSGPLFAGAIRSGFETQYLGRRLSLNRQASSYWLANLNLLTTRLGNGLELSTTMYNLFDRRYADPGSTEHAQDTIVQDGRTLRIKLLARF